MSLMIELIQRAKKYINSLYIDYGDLNDKAEEQIKQAFIDGMNQQSISSGVSSSAVFGSYQNMEIQKTWIVKRYNEYVKLHITTDCEYFIEGSLDADNAYRLIKIKEETAKEYLNYL
jgi:hypothetical protein